MPRKSAVEARKARDEMLERINAKVSAKDQKKMATEFFKGGITLPDLGAKYGLSKAEVQLLAREGSWTREKRRYTQEVIKKATDKAIESESDKLAQLMDASNKLDKALVRLLSSDDTEQSLFTPQDLQYMARALKDAVMAKRIVYNMPTLEEQARIANLSGRMSIEDEKLAILKREKEQEQDTGKSIEVVMTDEFKELSE